MQSDTNAIYGSKFKLILIARRNYRKFIVLKFFSRKKGKASVNWINVYRKVFKRYLNAELYSDLVIVQGVSYWNVRFQMALRRRRINNFIELWCLVASGSLEICVSSTTFQKNDMGWPQQPPTEKVPDISEKWYFLISIPQ